MPSDRQFIDRTKAVIGYLRSLKDLERTHRTPGRGFYRGARAIAASRAASFIMMYNCVEFGVRDTTTSLRRKIVDSGAEFVTLRTFWREELVKINFHDRIQQGTNHAELVKDFAAFIPGQVDWGDHVERTPFAGNIDNQRLIEFVRKIEHRWRPPPSTLGGDDLNLIRRMRNDLAHGKEDFEAIGSQFNTDELIQKYARVRTFMVSLLKTLDRYSDRAGYLA